MIMAAQILDQTQADPLFLCSKHFFASNGIQHQRSSTTVCASQ
jgi:hypothetical protein